MSFQTLSTTVYKLSKSNVNSKPKYRVIETKFGGGYRQIALDGINYEEETWSLAFIPMDSTGAIALENILVSSIVDYIKWTPPGETETKYFTAHEVSKTYVPPDKWQLSCQLRREYPLAQV